MIWDIAIVDGKSGGDFTIKGNDLAVCNSVENSIRLALTGGNVEADTKFPRVSGQEDLSWWGNALFMADNPSIQFNSLTERTLNKTPLNSVGRISIQNAIIKDLEFLSAKSVEVVIVSTDRINVSLRATLPTGAEGVITFSFVRNKAMGDFDLTDFNFNDFF